MKTSELDKLKHIFVTDLMEYYKIEETPFLRSHIEDLIKDIKPKQYREFLLKLSTSEMPYKNGFEKIATVAQSFKDEFKNVLFSDVKRRVKQLYDIMYELHRQIGETDGGNLSEKERFMQVYISKIRNKDSGELLFDELDIEVIKNLTKAWIYDTVVFDKSLFIEKAEISYKNSILERNGIKNVAITSTNSTKQIQQL